MPIRLTDLSPQAQQQALDLLDVPKRARRIPTPFIEPPPPTQRQQELQAVRRRLSIVAAQLTEARVEWAALCVADVLERLKAL